MSSVTERIPKSGEWPVDPQEDVPLSDDRVWVDGCFDFTHHGHAGALLQARQLGNELIVGLHSDEEILANKGPTVMNLEERQIAILANRWTTAVIPYAPYITSLPWITHYGCQYVVHGDDITSDASGQDCYRFVKAAERFRVVKRTPGISTTDLVGRMLLCTKTHFVRNVEGVLHGTAGDGSEEERKKSGEDLTARFKAYATDASGLNPGCDVWIWKGPADAALGVSPAKLKRRTSSKPDGGVSRMTSGSLNGAGSSSPAYSDVPLSTVSGADAGDVQTPPQAIRRSSTSKDIPDERGTFTQFVEGKKPRPGQRIVYVDGGFDLFTPGHIEFLRLVAEQEEKHAAERGWYDVEARKKRLEDVGEDYLPYFVIVGVHDDEVINHWKGLNYPIMNIFERGLCVLQCKYTHLILLSAPYTPSPSFLRSLPFVASQTHHHPYPSAVYHGPTSFMPTSIDPYRAARHLQLFREIPPHKFQALNAGTIVQRIFDSRAMFEERQRKKGVKGAAESELRREEREKEEREMRERQKKWEEVEREFGA
ncbi:hypothetical protein P152DRAFT_508797 [Eremomyces bilateralis CBS 781.70]|uniref:ethanolamine-phosphate cytidylyltransferase n=1 Tax=Eremomyces bilateralis CBS 781.70 TaxID=1392243 RepID=A0A6G1FWT5_9PEZI|nr:uncharacterized protein P152DRAFT_508797 [Eremomyces bilateralis CBS 781.70]KAF1810162.1 hypothetical protein P152DRAFT_508797 [Eremomyces bilateralis CBS 781.70]